MVCGLNNEEGVNLNSCLNVLFIWGKLEKFEVWVVLVNVVDLFSCFIVVCICY